MFEVRLHGALWKRVTEQRAAEWRRALDELNARNTIRAKVDELADEPAIEIVRPPDGTFLVRLYAGGFDLHAEVALEKSRVDELFDDYGTTIRQMVHVDREAPVRGFEAIDYAKRVIHDEAAAFLRESLDPYVEMGLSDARQLFTMVFLIGTDLPEALVRYHRRHG